MAYQTYNYTLDGGTQLKDAGLVAASAAGTVSAAATYVDLGAANAYAEFDVVVDWTACEIASNDELYTIEVQGSDTTAFTLDYVLAQKDLGAVEVLVDPVDTAATGRVVLHCDNAVVTSATDPNSVAGCRYIRVFCRVAGTVATGINYTAYLVPKSG